IYASLGNWSSWHQFEKQQRKLALVEEQLAQFKSPEQVIKKLKNLLEKKTKSAKGWYLLGRLYYSQRQWPQAQAAFTQALQLKPNYEAAAVNEVLCLWEQNQRQFSEPIRQKLSQILQSNPNEANILALAAKDDQEQGRTKAALKKWRKLLTLVDP